MKELCIEMVKSGCIGTYDSELDVEGVKLHVRFDEIIEGKKRFAYEEIQVIGCSKGACRLEELAAQQRVSLFSEVLDVTGKPEDFVKKRYEHMLSMIKSQPCNYTYTLGMRVKVPEGEQIKEFVA